MQIKCFPVTSQSDLERCFAIRQTVFVEEQNVPAAVERDGQDDTARHFAAAIEGKGADGKEGGEIIGTCRVRFIGSAAKIERVAVLKDYRKLGIGRVLMQYLLRELAKSGDTHLYKLSAQSFAVPFYEKLGFRTRGGEYMEAGMPHYDMVLER